jgi:hypothetical protein
MNLNEKSQKLLEYSVIIKGDEKSMWRELLAKMPEAQAKILYDVLVTEVRTWKKEGISIIPDLALELQLLPQPEHGTTLGDLKARLTGSPEAAKIPATPASTPENLKPVAPEPESQALSQANEPEEEIDEPLFNSDKPEVLNTAKNAWMLSNKVVVPKQNFGNIKPQSKAIPKVRNRVAKHGLSELKEIRTIDDLSKIEPAHLRQGPLPEQIMFLKQRIGQLARENDLLPINIIPVFEQSPLFQTYLKAGSYMIEKNIGDEKLALDQMLEEFEAAGLEGLTQQEFEAVADLKKDLESLAGI